MNTPENPYEVATWEELETRHINDMYDMLKGPDGFECLLTEPEDRRWCRDLKHVVTLLNTMHYKIKDLEEELRKYKTKEYEEEHNPMLVSDGFGNVWGPCAECGSKMQVVRPGKVQCPVSSHH